MAGIQDIKEALIAGNAIRLTEQVRSALEEGLAAKDILNQGLIAGMDVVGERMESGSMFIPQVLKCASVMRQAVAVLQPLLSLEDSSSAGTVVIGTVKGDLHDIGKNLVIMMMESGGFEVVDLGVDVPPVSFVEAIRAHNPQVVGLSALLTTTLPMVRETIGKIEESGLRAGVRIMVGGAPVTREHAGQINADGYAPDAASAVKEAKKLLSARGEKPGKVA
jgi:5-methyltetrahydrofolate--homocysteine methyltransferase